MDAPPVAVGSLRAGARWIGFAGESGSAPHRRGAALVLGGPGGSESSRHPAERDLLIALAVAYFEDALDPPPDEIAATHGDVASLVRALAGSEPDAARRSALVESVDAIDDGLGSDVVVTRLVAALPADVATDPVGWLVARAGKLARAVP